MKHLVKKIFLTALLIIGVSFGASRLLNEPKAQAIENITGWLWSSTSGWVSLSCQNTDSCAEVSYGVTEQSDGSWTGYGWSDNLGWLRFDAGCPSWAAGQCTAKRISDSIQGWARFCAPAYVSGCGGTGGGGTTGFEEDPGALTSNGWDGWVSLSSQNDHTSGHNNGTVEPSPYTYGLTWTNNELSGFVWGGDQVVGWMKYVAQETECPQSDPTCPQITSSLVANGAETTTIEYGQQATLTWSSTGADWCVGVGQGFDTSVATPTTGGSTQVVPDATTTYVVKCYKSTPSSTMMASDTATVVVTVEGFDYCPNMGGTQSSPDDCPGEADYCPDIPGTQSSPDDCEEEEPYDYCSAIPGIQTSPSQCPDENECALSHTNCPVTPGVPECSDDVDNTDTEDEFADELDPGCHTDGDATNSATYVPNDNSESNRRRPIYIEF